MEGRKLQLTGGSTYVVSLPKPWISATGLKPGDTVFLEPMPDGSISVLPKAGEKPAARRTVLEEQEGAQRDQEVDRLYWLVAKQYHLAHMTPTGASDARTRIGLQNDRLVAKLIERVGDHAQRIAEASLLVGERTLDPKLLREFEAASAASIAIFDKAFKALATQDIDLANEAVDARVPLQKMIDGLSHHAAAKKGEQPLALPMIADSVGRAGSYATDIAEIAINIAIAGDPESP